LHAIPNGGKRDIVTASKLKNEGVLRGIPDLFMPAMRGGFGGLYVEMKIKGGRVSTDQKRIQAGLVAEGYMVANCWEAARAIETIQDYLNSEFVKTDLLT